MKNSALRWFSLAAVSILVLTVSCPSVALAEDSGKAESAQERTRSDATDADTKVAEGDAKKMLEAARVEAKNAVKAAGEAVAKMEEAGKKAEREKTHDLVRGYAALAQRSATDWKTAATGWQDKLKVDEKDPKAETDPAKILEGAKSAKEKAEAAKKRYEADRKLYDGAITVAKNYQDPGLTNSEHFYFGFGVAALSPYAIKFQEPPEPEMADMESMDGTEEGDDEQEGRFYLDNSGVEARAFLEARARLRSAWDRAQKGIPLLEAEAAQERLEHSKGILERAKARQRDAVRSATACVDSGYEDLETSARLQALKARKAKEPTCTKSLDELAEEERHLERVQARVDEDDQALTEALSSTSNSALAEEVPPLPKDARSRWQLFCLNDDIKRSSMSAWEQVKALAPWSDEYANLGFTTAARCILPSDFDLRLGFNFAGEDASAATIAGSGDVNIGLGLGIPLVTYDSVSYAGTRWSSTLNFELGYEGVTERGVRRIHNRTLWGGGWVVGITGAPLRIPLAGSDTGENAKPERDRVYEFAVRGGWTRADVPVFEKIEEGDDAGEVATVDLGKGKRRPVIESDDGFPGYDMRSGYGLDVEFQAPYGKSGYVLMGASFLLGEELDPNPWSVRLGLTVPFKNIAGLFTDQ